MSISSIRSTWPWITSEISPPLIHIWELANLLEAPNPGGRVATCVPVCISKDVCRPARALGGEVQKLLPACLPGTLWLKISRDILIENFFAHLDHYTWLAWGKVVFHLKDGIRPTLDTKSLDHHWPKKRQRNIFHETSAFRYLYSFTSSKSVTTGMPRPRGAGSITFLE